MLFPNYTFKTITALLACSLIRWAHFCFWILVSWFRTPQNLNQFLSVLVLVNDLLILLSKMIWSNSGSRSSWFKWRKGLFSRRFAIQSKKVFWVKNEMKTVFTSFAGRKRLENCLETYNTKFFVPSTIYQFWFVKF